LPVWVFPNEGFGRACHCLHTSKQVHHRVQTLGYDPVANACVAHGSRSGFSLRSCGLALPMHTFGGKHHFLNINTLDLEMKKPCVVSSPSYMSMTFLKFASISRTFTIKSYTCGSHRLLSLETICAKRSHARQSYTPHEHARTYYPFHFLTTHTRNTTTLDFIHPLLIQQCHNNPFIFYW
jgi:hypothetical protein